MPEYEQYDREKHGRDTPQETFGPVVMVDKLEGGKIHLITMHRPAPHELHGRWAAAGGLRRLPRLP